LNILSVDFVDMHQRQYNAPSRFNISINESEASIEWY